MRELTREQVAHCVAILQSTIEQRKISQKQMEELSGVAQPTISKVLTHTADPSCEVLGKLLQAVGLTFRTILSDSDPATHDMLGYLATPLTSVVSDKRSETELYRVVGLIKSVAANFQDPTVQLYWPGDHTHPTRNPNFTASQVYLTDRSRASTHDFIVMFCGSPSYGVGQENEIATQAGLPAIRLVPQGLSRMMSGSFINTIDVPYSGSLTEGITFDLEALQKAFEQVKKLHFRYSAFFRQLNGNGFGATLRKLIDERTGDYKSFACDVGISISYLNTLMDEGIIVSNPSLRLIKRMARRLGTSVAFLIGETEVADPIWVASHASWYDWIERSDVPASVAMDLRNAWREEYRSQRTVQTAASFRKKTSSMTVGDWDLRYQNIRRAKSNAVKSLF